MKNKRELSRRGFLHLASLGLGSLFMRPLVSLAMTSGKSIISTFPDSERLGRVVWWGTELKTRPTSDSTTVRKLADDDILAWLREVIGAHASGISQRWVETPEGYVYSPHMQPARNQPNTPRKDLPQTSLGEGMWAEVSVPYVDLLLDNPPARAPWLKNKMSSGLPPRLYYSQIIWVDRIKTDDEGRVWYRVNERYGYGDIFWAAAEAFRPITPEEMAPISPEVENKRVVVSVPYQTLSCFEENTEVYFARISTGALYNASGERVDAWATPSGAHPIWRKLVSLHMSGGTTGGGWDLPGVGWTTLFVGSGVAVHSTFWHNNFGVPMSRGCVNAQPDDAKWVFRWTQPVVPYDPGDVTVQSPGGTIIEVLED